MAFEHKEMRGSMFNNKYKEEGDNKPHYKGDCLVNGAKLEVAAWIQDDSNGKKYMSLRFQPQREKSDPGAYVKPPPVPSAGDYNSRPKQTSDDSDIPF